MIRGTGKPTPLLQLKHTNHARKAESNMAPIPLTRHDAEGTGDYDSIQRAIEVHVRMPDTGIYNFALLCGNEDAPDKIELYRKAEPLVTDKPELTWTDAR